MGPFSMRNTMKYGIIYTIGIHNKPTQYTYIRNV